jgi:3'(2'), 5'-bisphosphate nucleotidase
MYMTGNENLLSKAIEISKQAGSLILQWYGDDSARITQKSDASPLTKADLASHNYIESALADTGIPLVSEENDCAFSVRKDWNLFWLVDPLDGTKDFLERNGEFTVSIALIRDGEPILGVVHAPAIGITYYAQKGTGAFCEKEGGVHKLPCFPYGELIIATVSRQHLSQITIDFLDKNGITRFAPKGSCLKFGIVASGRANIYPRFEGSMEWDIAAGHIIITESGCHIIDLVTGTDPQYNKRSFLNNPFIVYTPNIKYEKLSIPKIPYTRGE